MIGGGLALVALVLGAVLLSRRFGPDTPVVTSAVDGGAVAEAPTKDAEAIAVAVQVDPVAVDAGEAPENPPDAGIEEPSPDAAAASEPDKHTKSAEHHPGKGKGKLKEHVDKGGKKDTSSGGGTDSNPTTGVVTGPRAMWVPFDGDDKGPFEAAKKCAKSVIPEGPAKLSLKPCEKGCAVIIDGSCGGHTPITEMSVPVGNKNVTVVCGKTVVMDALAKLRPGETTTLSCR
jgi:hypothetical protein